MSITITVMDEVTNAPVVGASVNGQSTDSFGKAVLSSSADQPIGINVVDGTRKVRLEASCESSDLTIWFCADSMSLLMDGDRVGGMMYTPPPPPPPPDPLTSGS